MTLWNGRRLLALAGLLSLLVAAGCDPSGTANSKPGTAKTGAASSVEILNVSHDPTRELWKAINERFTGKYEQDHGVVVSIKQSHAASGSQARAIIDGLEADVATLSIWSDTDSLRKQGLIPDKWDERLPNRSLPYTSTLVFVVRKGNPRKIADWPDLVKGDVAVITPNPKTSGNGKLSFLAAWGHIRKGGGSDADAQAFVTELFRRAPVLDTGARGATTTFSQKGIGDVHLAIENEAHLEVEESKGTLEIVYPRTSIIHEPHVTVVDKVVDHRGTREVAEAYLKFAYSDEAQEIMAKHHFRPSNPAVFARHKDHFPEIALYPLTEIVSGWDEAQKRFFSEGGLFDTIYGAAKGSAGSTK